MCSLVKRYEHDRAIIGNFAPQHAIRHQSRLPATARSPVGEEEIDLARFEFWHAGDDPTHTILEPTGDDRLDHLTRRDRALDDGKDLEFGRCRHIFRPLQHAAVAGSGKKYRVAVQCQLTRIGRRDDGRRPRRPRPQGQHQQRYEPR